MKNKETDSENLPEKETLNINGRLKENVQSHDRLTELQNSLKELTQKQRKQEEVLRKTISDLKNRQNQLFLSRLEVYLNDLQKLADQFSRVKESIVGRTEKIDDRREDCRKKLDTHSSLEAYNATDFLLIEYVKANMDNLSLINDCLRVIERLSIRFQEDNNNLFKED